MKIIVWLIILTAVAVAAALGSNLLRCMSASAEKCSAWCAVRPVKCRESICDYRPGCQAPSWNEYRRLTGDWLEKNFYKKKK